MQASFGEQLFTLRRAKKLMQKQVAADAKIDQSYLALLERNRRSPPGRALLTRLARVLCSDESERTRLIQLAEIGRLVAAVDDAADYLEGHEQIRDLLLAVPNMSKHQRELFSALACTLSKSEVRM